MYNQEIKERYLETLNGSTLALLKGVFETSAEFEYEAGKDIAEFDADLIGNYFESFGFSEPNTIRTKLGYIASYADWYSNYFETVNQIRSYDIVRFPYAQLLQNEVIKSPEQLLNIITQIYDIDSGQPAIGALCLAWLGISSADALKLRNEQVDAKNGKIYDATGGIIVNQMPDCIRETLEIYSKTYSAIRVQNQTFTVYADDRGYFIKRMITANSGKAGKPISTSQMSTWISELRRAYDEKFKTTLILNYASVQRSGNFYRLHQLDLAGVDVHDIKNADKVRMCLGQSKRYHKDNMIMYDAYLECIDEK